MSGVRRKNQLPRRTLTEPERREISAATSVVAGTKPVQAHVVVGQVQETQISAYQGELPHPDHLRAFESIYPGITEIMLTEARGERAHRQSLERRAMDIQEAHNIRVLDIQERQVKGVVRSDLIGQVFGLITVLSALAGSVYLGASGAPWQAVLGLAAIPTAAIILAFRTNVFNQKGNVEKEPNKKTAKA